MFRIFLFVVFKLEEAGGNSFRILGEDWEWLRFGLLVVFDVGFVNDLLVLLLMDVWDVELLCVLLLLLLFDLSLNVFK